MEKGIQNHKIEKVTDTALDLFRRYGIRRVTVEEICSEANISKMTFYKYFKNKIELTKYLLIKNSEKQRSEYRKIMSERIPYPEKAQKIIQLKHDQTYLISQEFFDDLYKNPIPELVELLAKLREDSMKEILKDFKMASKKGEIRKNVKPEFIVYIINQLSEMSKDEKLKNLYRSPNEVTMALTNLFFYGILNKRENLEEQSVYK
jgi:AcrR family transcriptional regulator